jgi:hypothetical protein
MNVLHLETFAGRIVDGIVAEVERSALKIVGFAKCCVRRAKFAKRGG